MNLDPEDIAEAQQLARAIFICDRMIFPHAPAPVELTTEIKTAGAAFVPREERMERYCVHIPQLHEKLNAERLLIVQRFAGYLPEHVRAGWGHWALRWGIAIHEVRHRLQYRLVGTLRLWHPGPQVVRCEMQRTMTGAQTSLNALQLSGQESFPQEQDAKTVEHYFYRSYALALTGVSFGRLSDIIWLEP